MNDTRYGLMIVRHQKHCKTALNIFFFFFILFKPFFSFIVLVWTVTGNVGVGGVGNIGFKPVLFYFVLFYFTIYLILLFNKKMCIYIYIFCKDLLLPFFTIGQYRADDKQSGRLRAVGSGKVLELGFELRTPVMQRHYMLRHIGANIFI